MVKGGFIGLRCNSKLYEILAIYSKNYGIKISDLVRSMIETSLMEHKSKLDKTIKKKVIELQRENALIDISKEWKSDNRKIYLIKNFLMIISNMLLSSYILTRTLNMDIVNLQVDYAKKVYKNFPLKIKKLLKIEMQFINKCNNEEFLQERFQNILEIKNRKMLK